MASQSVISFDFVPELLRAAKDVWASVATYRDERGDAKRAAVVGHLTQTAQIIKEFVDVSTEADWIDQNVSLCSRLKVYAVDLKKVTVGAGLSDAQYATLRDALLNACQMWPSQDAFHQGRALSDEARRTLKASAAEIAEFAELLKSGRGPVAPGPGAGAPPRVT